MPDRPPKWSSTLRSPHPASSSSPAAVWYCFHCASVTAGALDTFSSRARYWLRARRPRLGLAGEASHRNPAGFTGAADAGQIGAPAPAAAHPPFDVQPLHHLGGEGGFAFIVPLAQFPLRLLAHQFGVGIFTDRIFGDMLLHGRASQSGLPGPRMLTHRGGTWLRDRKSGV